MFKAAISAEQVRALYRQGAPLVIANAINAVLVALVLWSPRAEVALGAWVMATAAVAALRLALRRRFLAAAPSVQQMTPWARGLVAASLVAGLLWGIGAVAFFDPNSVGSQMLLVLVIAGNTAAAAGTQARYMPAFLGYFLGAIVPFAVRVAMVGDTLHLGMAAMTALYGLVLVMVARGTHATIREVFRLRFENEELVASLSEASTALGTTNAALEQRVKERTAEVERQAEALRAARQMEAIGRLVAGIAHDFNNLLTVVVANGTDLMERPLDQPVGRAPRTVLSPDDRAALEDIVTSGSRGADLVRQLLAFARQQHLDPRTFDLNDLVHEGGRLLGRLIGAHIDLKLATASEPVLVHADRGQLHQVLTNLVTNARDAMPNGGTIVVTTGAAQIAGHATLATGRYAVLTVRDTGTGMDAETVSRAFEPFFTTKETGKGTGLGLATVHGIVHQSSGTVEITSRAQEGTEVRVFLPQSVQPSDPPSPSSPTTDVAKTVSPVTVLIVEDQALVRSVMTRIVTGLGHETLWAADGPSAVAKARAHAGHIALLVTDVVMPGTSGPLVYEQLKRDRPDLRVLFVSGYSADELAPRKAEPGVAFLAKPFTPQELAANITRLITALPST